MYWVGVKSPASKSLLCSLWWTLTIQSQAWVAQELCSSYWPQERIPEELWSRECLLRGCPMGWGLLCWPTGHEEEEEITAAGGYFCVPQSVEDCVAMQEIAWRTESVIPQGIHAKTVQLCNVKYQRIQPVCLVRLFQVILKGYNFGSCSFAKELFFCHQLVPDLN